MMYGDGRRLPPRNSRGEFRRRRRGDRGMPDYGYMNYDMARGGRGGRGVSRSEYGEYDMPRGNDMRSMDYRGGDYRSGQIMRDRGDYAGNMGMSDGHHYPQGQGSTYYPIEAMGRFNGYWGVPEQDYGRYDMRGGRRNYGYDYGDYRDYGDYGETLSEQEIEKWSQKLMSQLDERERQMFHKDSIMQKARSMGKQMEGFGEKELWITTLMIYSDYKQSIGQNPDLAIKLAFDWLTDKDVAVKGAEKLAIYYDCIVEGED